MRDRFPGLDSPRPSALLRHRRDSTPISISNYLLTVAEVASRRPHEDPASYNTTPSTHRRHPRQVAPTQTKPHILVAHRTAQASASSHATRLASTSPTSTATYRPNRWTYRTTPRRSATLRHPPINPRVVLISENKDTAIHFPAHIAGGISVEGAGYGGKTQRLPMAHQRAHLMLLGRHRRPRLRNPQRLPRRRCPSASILMDIDTYERTNLEQRRCQRQPIERADQTRST